MGDTHRFCYYVRPNLPQVPPVVVFAWNGLAADPLLARGPRFGRLGNSLTGMRALPQPRVRSRRLGSQLQKWPTVRGARPNRLEPCYASG